MFAAADHLASGGFWSQAVARSYYGVYVLVDAWARRQTQIAWPTYNDGSARGSVPHSLAPRYAAAAFAAASSGQVTTRAMNPPHVHKAAIQLKDQRLLADYISWVEIPEGSAVRMMRNAREIAGVLSKAVDAVALMPSVVKE